MITSIKVNCDSCGKEHYFDAAWLIEKLYLRHDPYFTKVSVIWECSCSEKHTEKLDSY